MEGIESSSQADELQQYQQILEADKQRRQQTERQIASQAESIEVLQRQLQTIQSAFGQLQQQHASAEEARRAAEQAVID